MKILFRITGEIFQYLRFSFCRQVWFGRHVRIEGSVGIKPQGGSIRIGKKTELLHGVLLYANGGQIIIGEKCSINPYTVIYGHGAGTTIGNNVLIAGHCMLIPNNHIFADTVQPINMQGCISKGIIIEDDVWLGNGCSILDGVTIGRGSVIGAGSVVNKNIPPYSIAVGVPVRIISNRIRG
jgi:acetyltransferase-like isoleucine patch superfamily enzyme